MRKLKLIFSIHFANLLIVICGSIYIVEFFAGNIFFFRIYKSNPPYLILSEINLQWELSFCLQCYSCKKYTENRNNNLEKIIYFMYRNPLQS